MLSLRSYLLIGFLNLFTLPLYIGTTTFLYRKKNSMPRNQCHNFLSFRIRLSFANWGQPFEDFCQNRLKQIFVKMVRRQNWTKPIQSMDLAVFLSIYSMISMKVRRRKTLQKPNKPYVLQVNGHQPLISSIDQNVLALELLLE